MLASVLPVARLADSERLAVSLLRGSTRPDFDAQILSDFRILARAARGAELRIAEPDCPYLWPDEAALLGCLALLQRDCAPIGLVLEHRLLIALHRCAWHLANTGRRLQYRNVSRIPSRMLAARHEGAERAHGQASPDDPDKAGSSHWPFV